MRFTKQILRPGTYQAQQGPFDAWPERLKNFAQKFGMMKARGIRVPIAWGHQPEAEPFDPQSDPERAAALKEYLSSKLNAGYLEDMRYNPKTQGLDIVGDVPAVEEIDAEGNLIYQAELPDGQKVKSAIKEVSAGIRNWTDGRGNPWDDVVVHLALCVLPVVAGQDGFTQLSKASSGTGLVYLSLSSLLPRSGAAGARAGGSFNLGGRPMDAAQLERDQEDGGSTGGKKPTATPPNSAANKQPAAIKSGSDEASLSRHLNRRWKNLSTGKVKTTRQLSLDTGADLSKWLATDEGEDETGDPPAMMAEGGENAEPPTGAASQAGRDMPGSSADDANYKEFLMDMAKCGLAIPENTPKKDFFKSAHGALKTKLATMNPAGNPDEGNEGGPDTPGNGGKQKPGEGAAIEEQRPILMSLANTNLSPTERFLIRDKQERSRKDRLDKIASLKNRGMPNSEVAKLTKRATEYTLSLRADGTEVQSTLDLELRTWDKALPAPGVYQRYLATGQVDETAIQEEGRPEGANNEDMADYAKQRAAAVSRAK